MQLLRYDPALMSNSFGEIIRDLRLKHRPGFTQPDLALAAGVSVMTVSMLENADAPKPRQYKTVGKIAKVFGMTETQLMELYRGESVATKLELPKKLFSELSAEAKRSGRSVADVIIERLHAGETPKLKQGGVAGVITGAELEAKNARRAASTPGEKPRRRPKN